MRKLILLSLMTVLLTTCFRFEPTGRRAQENPPQVTSEPTEQPQLLQPPGPGRSIRLPAINCQTIAKSVNLAFLSGRPENQWERTVRFPASGRFVKESHYVTTADKFRGGRLFADSDSENINAHLERSLQLYRQYDPSASKESLYSQPWEKQWTPAEGGAIGQGSVGDIQVSKLTPEMELWMITMMWAAGEKPPMETRFLLRFGAKMVVVVAGFETGPGGSEYLGGVTPEVHHWLGTTSRDRIEVLWLQDQTVPVGPVVCTGQ